MEAFATATSTPLHTSPEVKNVSIEFVCKLYTNEFNTDDANNVKRLGQYHKPKTVYKQIFSYNVQIEQSLKKIIAS